MSNERNVFKDMADIDAGDTKVATRILTHFSAYADSVVATPNFSRAIPQDVQQQTSKAQSSAKRGRSG